MLTHHGLGDTAELATLLVNELVTNAILHAGTDIEVRLHRGPTRIRVEVADSGAGVVTTRDYGTDASTGRGLVLVEELADAWGTEGVGHGKVVWFELDASPVLQLAESGT